MAIAEASRRFEVPAAEMWARIGDFYRLHDWHPAVEDVVRGTEPNVRQVTTATGLKMAERLVDEGALTHTYAIEDCESLGMRGHRSTILVREDGASACVVEWSGTFEAVGASEADIAAASVAFFQAGFDSLGASDTTP